MRTQRNLLLFILAFSVLVASPAARADETSIFTNIAPDAMFVVDFSGSMGWNPPGNTSIGYYGPDASCAGPYGTGSVDCRRISIAKRSIFSLLDDNADKKIDCFDKASLNIRLGYMSFRSPEDTAFDPLAGNQMVKWPIGTDYHKMYCNANAGCGTGAYSCTVWNYGYGATFAMESAGGGTPLNYALKEMKAYLDTHKAADTAKNCRQKFVILLSDGADTYSCAGPGSETGADMYKRRRLSVLRAKAAGRRGLQDLRHRIRREHACVPEEHAQLDGLLRGHGQPAGGQPRATRRPTTRRSMPSARSRRRQGPATARARTATPHRTTRATSRFRVTPSSRATPRS